MHSYRKVVKHRVNILGSTFPDEIPTMSGVQKLPKQAALDMLHKMLLSVQLRISMDYKHDVQ